MKKEFSGFLHCQGCFLFTQSDDEIPGGLIPQPWTHVFPPQVVEYRRVNRHRIGSKREGASRSRIIVELFPVFGCRPKACLQILTGDEGLLRSGQLRSKKAVNSVVGSEHMGKGHVEEVLQVDEVGSSIRKEPVTYGDRE